MSGRNVAILVILAVIITAGVTRYYFPQVEYKNVEVVKEVVKNDIRTIVRTVERPDGTKETTTDTTDRSTRRETTKNETIIAAKPQWMVGVGAGTKFDDRGLVVYDLQVQRRIVGPFYLGARAATDKSVGVSIGMEF